MRSWLIWRTGSLYGGERVVLTRHGRPFVAWISAEDLSLLGKPRPLAGTTSSPADMSSSPEQSYPMSIAATYQPFGRAQLNRR